MSLDEDGKIIKAWIYFIKKFKPQLLEQQMFSNYSSKGSHGLNYVTRYNRIPTYNYKSEILLDL